MGVDGIEVDTHLAGPAEGSISARPGGVLGPLPQRARLRRGAAVGRRHGRARPAHGEARHRGPPRLTGLLHRGRAEARGKLRQGTLPAQDHGSEGEGGAVGAAGAHPARPRRPVGAAPAPPTPFSLGRSIATWPTPSTPPRSGTGSRSRSTGSRSRSSSSSTSSPARARPSCGPASRACSPAAPRADLQVRRQGGQAGHRGEGDAVPLQGGRRLQLHGQQDYEQTFLTEEQLGEPKNFLKENINAAHPVLQRQGDRRVPAQLGGPQGHEVRSGRARRHRLRRA